MRYLPSLLPCLLFFLIASSHLAAQETTITVAGSGCPTVKLFRFNGATFTEEAEFTKNDSGAFAFTTEYNEVKFRYVGSKAGDVLPVLIKPGESFTISGKCGRLRSGKVADSPANADYQALKLTFQQQNGRFTTATKAHQVATQKADSVAVAAALQDLSTLDAEKLKNLAELKQRNPFLGRVAALNTYQSYLTGNEGRFKNELDYFINTYFENVDYQDAGYNDLPWTFEGNRNYVNTLSNAVPDETLASVLLQIYDRWPAGSRAQFFAMSGGFSSLAQKKHPAAAKVADVIIQRFDSTETEAVALIKQQSAGLRTFAVGAEAPTFGGQNPEGETITLESLRGKVVLIDFWASWCGPCRRENPNVVRVYERFKEQGFEIFGVSLDRNRERWVKAITDDGLTWPQISDLKGWQSAVAKQYGVTSIPQTVLLDGEGRILARNLRGAALEQKLAEVFAVE